LRKYFYYWHYDIVLVSQLWFTFPGSGPSRLGELRTA